MASAAVSSATHCWGSEESDPSPAPRPVLMDPTGEGGGKVWGFGTIPGTPPVGGVRGPWPSGCLVRGGSGGVGLLFEIWIVDASIFRTRVPHVPATLLGWWAGVVWGCDCCFCMPAS